jgi:hypothetical protein
VHHARAVRGIERVGDLGADPQHVGRGERPAEDALGERLAIDQLHHQVVGRAFAADVVEGADVGMAQAGDEPRLALETRARAVARGEVLGQHFDRDVTAEPGVPGAVDLPHPAGAEGGNDLVGAEAAPGMEWHLMNLA